MLSSATESYSEEERLRLRQAMISAPGVTGVGDISRHPRGGYGVNFDFDGDPYEEFEAYLRAAGFMWVI